MTTSYERSPAFYMENIIFRAEDTLFRVPKTYFVKNSAIFRDMFSLPVNDQQKEGSSDDNPIFLEGIKSTDFEMLLGFIYPDPYCHHPGKPSPSQDITEVGIMREAALLPLCRKWRFQGIHHELVRRIENSFGLAETNPATKVEMGREHRIPNWVRSGYFELSRRSTPPSLQESMKLGWVASVRLFHLREEAGKRLGYPGQSVRVLTDNKRPSVVTKATVCEQSDSERDAVFNKLLDTSFSDELALIGEDYRAFYEVTPNNATISAVDRDELFVP